MNIDVTLITDGTESIRVSGQIAERAVRAYPIVVVHIGDVAIHITPASAGKIAAAFSEAAGGYERLAIEIAARKPAPVADFACAQDGTISTAVRP